MVPECCGKPMVKKLKKGGRLVAKCQTCGARKKLGVLEKAVPLLQTVETRKAAFDEALKAALIAKYDVLFNYRPTSEEQNTEVADLATECLKRKKAYEEARDDYAKSVELPDIPLEKMLSKTVKTETAYKTQSEIRQKVWATKFKVPESGPRPPLEQIWWFNVGDV
jgi:hypothetical protein